MNNQYDLINLNDLNEIPDLKENEFYSVLSTIEEQIFNGDLHYDSAEKFFSTKHSMTKECLNVLSKKENSKYENYYETFVIINTFGE